MRFPLYKTILSDAGYRLKFTEWTDSQMENGVGRRIVLYVSRKRNYVRWRTYLPYRQGELDSRTLIVQSLKTLQWRAAVWGQ